MLRRFWRKVKTYFASEPKLDKDELLDITKRVAENYTPPTLPTGVKPKGHIALVVGHTRNAGGAYSNYLKMDEYTYNTDLALKIAKICQMVGLTCSIHFRDGIGIAGAYRAALATKPMMIIELHFNAANGTATGSECLFSDQYDKAGVKELMLAQLLAAKMSGSLGIRNRGAKRLAKGEAERGLQNVSQTTNIPSVLIETGFGDNSQIDAVAMKNKKDALANSIVQAAVEWQQQFS